MAFGRRWSEVSGGESVVVSMGRRGGTDVGLVNVTGWWSEVSGGDSAVVSMGGREGVMWVWLM